MKKNKFILFDAMGVLFTVGDDTNDLLVPFVKEKSPSIITKDIINLYMKASLGEISSQAFWDGVGLSQQYPYVETEYLFTKIEINKDIYKILPLIEYRYNLAILSNDVSEWSTILREKYLLNKYFKSIISGDVKRRKPDREIYLHTLQKFCVLPENCVFIDDREKNLTPAAELGMKVIHYAKSGRNLQNSKYETISSLLELPDKLLELL